MFDLSIQALKQNIKKQYGSNPMENENISNNTKNTQKLSLINYDTVVVLLYNCLKAMLGVNQLDQQV